MLKANKKLAGYWLQDVPQEKVFWCCDGRVVKGLEELGVALRQMDDQTFGYHCNQEKSDFSRWVQDIIGDEKLAADLRKISERSVAAGIVSRRVAQLQKLAGGRV